MRHGNTVNALGRKASHRAAMMSNMASSLLKSEKKRIITTLAKAKALRKFVEPLITRSRDNTTHSRRLVFSYLSDKEAVHELFSTIAGKIGDRPGGYTRILKLGPRKGDNAEMALIELVDYNEFIKETKKKTTRRRKKAVTGEKTTSGRKPSAKAEKTGGDSRIEEAPAQENAENAGGESTES